MLISVAELPIVLHCPHTASNFSQCTVGVGEAAPPTATSDRVCISCVAGSTYKAAGAQGPCVAVRAACNPLSEFEIVGESIEPRIGVWRYVNTFA